MQVRTFVLSVLREGIKAGTIVGTRDGNPGPILVGIKIVPNMLMAN